MEHYWIWPSETCLTPLLSAFQALFWFVLIPQIHLFLKTCVVALSHKVNAIFAPLQPPEGLTWRQRKSRHPWQKKIYLKQRSIRKTIAIILIAQLAGKWLVGSISRRVTHDYFILLYFKAYLREVPCNRTIQMLVPVYKSYLRFC